MRAVTKFAAAMLSRFVGLALVLELLACSGPTAAGTSSIPARAPLAQTHGTDADLDSALEELGAPSSVYLFEASSGRCVPWTLAPTAAAGARLSRPHQGATLIAELIRDGDDYFWNETSVQHWPGGFDYEFPNRCPRRLGPLVAIDDHVIRFERITLFRGMQQCIDAGASDLGVALCKEDLDDDRVIGVADQCPDEKEVYNGRNDEDGCPDLPHGRSEPTPLPGGRPVAGPERPPHCPIFRRTLSVAGDLESWNLEFLLPYNVNGQFPQVNIDRVVAALTSIASPVEMWAESGQNEEDSEDLRLKRLQVVRQLLLDRGVPGTNLTVLSHRPKEALELGKTVGRVRFRVSDRRLVTTTYTCYPDTR